VKQLKNTEVVMGERLMFLALFFCAVSCGGTTETVQSDPVTTTTATTSTTEPDGVAIVIVPHAGEVDMSDALVRISIADAVLSEAAYGEYKKSPFIYDRNLGAPKNLMVVSLQLEDYLSYDIMVSANEIMDAESELAVDVPLARDLRGDDWTCTARWIVDGEPTGEEEPRDGTISMSLDEPENCLDLSLDMWFETMQIVGDEVFGEQYLVVYIGSAASNDDVTVLRAVKDDQDNGLEFECHR